jgi:phosphoribosylformylglycinamidine synthase subunit PurS
MGAIGLVRWLAEVHVTLRPGIADPEGQTVAGGLRSLGFETVGEVRSGKLLRVALEANDSETAQRLVADMCRRLLANPVMEVATWELRADAAGGDEERME